MNKLSRLGWGASLGLILSLACTDSDELKPTEATKPAPGAAGALGGEIVNAGTPKDIPGQAIAARFWLEGDAAAGTITAYEIHPGNIIYRDQAVSLTTQELRYNYTGTATRDTTCTPGATCVPPANTVRLSTPANTVTFVDAMGNCTSNGAPCGTAGNHAAFPAGDLTTCSEPNTFCFNAQLVSKYAAALPNVMLRFANPGAGASACSTPPAAPIIGCQPNSGSNRLGLCETSHPAATDVADSSESSLASCIPGDGTTGACNYCLGNNFRAGNAGFPGLGYVVLPDPNIMTADATMRGINTVTPAFKLTGNTTFNVVTEVRYSTPAFAAAAGHLVVINGDPMNMDCAIPGTTWIQGLGGGFGPPRDCHVLPLASCSADQFDDPPSTAPAAGYSVSLGGVQVPADHYVQWSDREVAVLVPMTASGSNLRMLVTTPVGSGQSVETFNVCGGGPNSWQALTGDPITAIQPASGLLGGNIVIAGGRTSSSGASGTTAVRFFAVPTTTSYTLQATAPSLPASRWGAGSVVANGRLWVIGGASSSLACATSTYSLGDVTDMMWTTGPVLPASRCNPTAVAIGQYIYVTGGTSLPSGGGTQRTGTCRLDTMNTGAGWDCATFTMGDDIPVTARGFGSAASTGTVSLIVGGRTTGGGTLDATESVSSAVAGNPDFAAATVLPAARLIPGMASAGAFFYVHGGQTATALDAAGTTTLWRTSNAAPGAWTPLTPTGPSQARTGHALVSAQCGGCMAEQLFAIGGSDGSSPVTSVHVYTQ